MFMISSSGCRQHTGPCVEDAGAVDQHMCPILGQQARDLVLECNAPDSTLFVPGAFLHPRVELYILLQLVFVREA